jgi:hypothetical protein
MRRFVVLLSLLVLLPFAFSTPALAAKPLTTLTFDELTFQPVDGLSFGGVTFGFQINGVPSTDAHYGAFGPGSTTFVQDPSLEGNSAGVLTLTFDQPTTVLEFGLARSCLCTLTPGVTVELFKPGAARRSRGIITLTTSPVVSFSEGLFSYSGPAIQTAVITFPSPGLASRFAFDNLKFHQGEG